MRRGCTRPSEDQISGTRISLGSRNAGAARVRRHPEGCARDASGKRRAGSARVTAPLSSRGVCTSSFGPG